MADEVFPNIPSDLVLKLIVFGGALAFLLLLVSFQFIIAIIILIITIISYVFFKQKQAS